MGRTKPIRTTRKHYVKVRDELIGTATAHLRKYATVLYLRKRYPAVAGAETRQ